MKKINLLYLFSFALFLAGCQQLAVSPSYTCIEDDVNVILVTDFSGSMLPYETILKDSLKTFSANLISNSRNKVGIVTYNQDVFSFINPTNDINLINNFVNQIGKPNGQTCIGCGLEKAKTMLSSVSTLNNNIVLFSDGAPNVRKLSNGSLSYCFVSPTSSNECTQYTLDQANKIMNEIPNTEITTLYYVTNPSDTSNSFAITLMNQIAVIGKGQSFVAQQTDNLVDVYNQIVNKICIPTCNINSPNYCSVGETRCAQDSSGKSIIQECVDANSDTCGDSFTIKKTCNVGLNCVNSECVCSTNQCTLGQKFCDATSSYKECIIDSNGCTKISDTKQCSLGQVCSGGVCGCPQAVCNIGSRQCVGDTQYKDCGIFSGVCPSYTSPISCPATQVCRDNQCNCPDTGNNIGNRKCAGDGYQVFDVQGSDLCPSWSGIISCPSGQSCNSGVCGCPNTGFNVGDKRCSTALTYQEYAITNNQCPTWSNQINCPQGQTCNNGICGCSATTNKLGDVKCDTSASYQIWSVYLGTCPSWGNTINCASGQVCSNGICSCPTNQCSVGETRCNNNVVEECEVVGVCAKWVTRENCGQASICNQFSPAQCYPIIGNINIFTSDSYALNEPITVNLEVESLSSTSGIKVFPSLRVDGNIIQSPAQALFLINNKLQYTFAPINQIYGKVEVVFRLQKDEIIVEKSQEINVKQGMGLTLSNTPPNFINEEATILINVQPSNINYFINNVKIIDPENQIISPSLVNVVSIKFTPTKLGTYKIDVDVSAPNFKPTTSSITLNIQSKSISVDYYLDNQDITTISNGYIDKGKHTFTIKSTETGNKPKSLDNIDLDLIPPEGTGSKQKLTFIKISEGESKTTIDLKLGGREYTISGFLQKFGNQQIPDINIPVNIAFKTVGETTGDGGIIPTPTTSDLGKYLPYIIGGVILFIGIIVLSFVFRRKR